MIRVRLYVGADGSVTGFDADSHGDEIVCAAVSALAINAVNSVESLSGAKYTVDCKDGQYIKFRLAGGGDANARLLLESLRLGLRSIAGEYPGELDIGEAAVQ